MKKQECENCKYWLASEEIKFNEKSLTGECRRYPPVLYFKRSDIFIFPITDNDNWCGEYKEKISLNKINKASK